MSQELTVTAAAAKRRSTKAFKTDPIPDDILKKILDATIAAPSSFNMQPTRIVLIRSDEQKQALAAVAWGQKQILQAPVTMIFAVALRGWEKNLEPIVQQAVSAGAWGDKMAAMARAAVPDFQKNLGSREREYAVKDAIISATHAALAAEALGLGSCFMNGWVEEGVKKIIGVEGNPDIAIALLLPIGYALETPKNPGRLPQSQTVFIDRFV